MCFTHVSKSKVVSPGWSLLGPFRLLYGLAHVCRAFSLHKKLSEWRSLTHFSMDLKIVFLAGPWKSNPPTALYFSVTSLFCFLQVLLNVALGGLGTVWLMILVPPALRSHFAGVWKIWKWLIFPIGWCTARISNWHRVNVSWFLIALESQEDSCSMWVGLTGIHGYWCWLNFFTHSHLQVTEVFGVECSAWVDARRCFTSTGLPWLWTSRSDYFSFLYLYNLVGRGWAEHSPCTL